MRRVYGLARFGGWSAILFALGSAAAWGASPELKATIVDRMGNQHEVSRLTYQGQTELDYYVDDQQRTARLADLERFQLEGEREDEEQKITLVWRTGRIETGRIFTGGAGIAPHQDALGGGQTANRLSGVTDLGPFFILLSDVREVILRHPESLAPAKEPKLKATVVNLEGKRFEVSNLRFRGQLRLDFSQGRKQRSIELTKLAKIEFTDEGNPGTEFRPVILTFWSGKTVQGMVDASTVRLSGETDRIYQTRVGAAFTGDTPEGAFAIGLHQLKLMRFYPEEGEEPPAGEAAKKTPEP